MLEIALVAALDHLLLISFSVQGQLSQVNAPNVKVPTLTGMGHPGLA